jgi:hypothetical protein
MTILLDERVPRTLDILLRDWARDDHKGTVLEAWLFEDEVARREAERMLADAGIHARLRSAYKPLVHAFLEEFERAGLVRATVRYPVHEKADRLRFLSEAYPLAALLEGIETRFESGDTDLTYEITLEYADESIAKHEVFAPNRLRTNHLDQVDLTPTGWLKVTARADGGPDLDEPAETEVEQVFHKAMAAVMAHDWPEQEPYAETLAIDVTIQGIERPLDYGDEVMSTREALHEDFYFSLLEFFKHRSGRPPQDRGLQPGQIVPDIRAGEGDAHVRVSLRSFGAPQDSARPEQDIETADAAPSLAQIHRELAALPGETFEGISREGRPVRGLYRPFSSPAGSMPTRPRRRSARCGPCAGCWPIRRPTLLTFRSRTRMVMPCTDASARAIRATCIMRRATRRLATIWSMAEASLSTRLVPATRRWPYAARSCTSTSMAIRPMNGPVPSQATCRGASSSGRSRRASS